MNDQDGQSGSTATTAASEQATYRLVIRARIIPETLSGSPAPFSRRSATQLVAIGVAALAALSWIGITIFRTDPAPRTSAKNHFAEAQSEARTPVVAAPKPAPDIGNESPGPAITAPDGTPLPVQEVVPDPPQSALQTIRGTVRVAIRVSIDKQGFIVAATPHEPGPSRYFERLSLEASRKWVFAPASTDERRSALLRFDFTRNGATARASSLR